MGDVRRYSWHDICRQNSSDDEYIHERDFEPLLAELVALRKEGCPVCGCRMFNMTNPPKCTACYRVEMAQREAASARETLARVREAAGAVRHAPVTVSVWRQEGGESYVSVRKAEFDALLRAIDGAPHE